jgi:hypothetical protein
MAVIRNDNDASSAVRNRFGGKTFALATYSGDFKRLGTRAKREFSSLARLANDKRKDWNTGAMAEKNASVHEKKSVMAPSFMEIPERCQRKRETNKIEFI